MYFHSFKVKGYRSNTYKNFEKATVFLNQKEILLNYDAYTKRKKIYNEKDLWIDTTPLAATLDQKDNDTV
jgi:hypothetical protein